MARVTHATWHVLVNPRHKLWKSFVDEVGVNVDLSRQGADPHTVRRSVMLCAARASFWLPRLTPQADLQIYLVDHIS